MELLVIVLVWIIIGATGFIFWYTKESDYHVGDVILTLIVMWVGPLTWLIGLLMSPTIDKVLIKRRK